MAKKHYKAPLHQTGTTITTRTAFGSDSDMIVDLSSYKPISIGNDQVVCRDDRGFYITQKNRIDTGLADPNRYANTKSRIVLEELKEPAA